MMMNLSNQPNPFNHWLTHPLTLSLTHHLLTHSFTHSLIHSLTHKRTDVFFLSCLSADHLYEEFNTILARAGSPEESKGMLSRIAGSLFGKNRK